MKVKHKNIEIFFYAEVFNRNGPDTFCSYMKNLKSDDNRFYDMALKLANKIEPFKNLFDVFVSVPKYNIDLSQIDYSQKIAKILALKLNIPFEKTIISKIKDTKKLRVLTHEERGLEISSAFKVNTDKYKRICIVDDVYSSGATIQEIAKTFNQSNITDISVAVLVVQSQDKL